MPKPSHDRKGRLSMAYALRSFVGYLEGTSKAAHTIKNYRLDLAAFESFLASQYRDRPIRLESLTREDLEAFHSYLKQQGLKTNTRRRKLMTVRRFLGYLAQRNRIPMDLGRRLLTPHKIERIPFTVPSDELIRAIRAMPKETLLDLRNQALLWTLAETGCLVSEATRIRFEDWQSETPGPMLQIHGKSARSIPVSAELHGTVQELRQRSKDSPWLFLGFNKFGSLGAPITPRGVEILVRLHAARLGFPELTPRTFRHSAVLRWNREGLSRDEIQKRLGLKTAYSFRAYEPLFKQGVETGPS